MNNRNDKLLIIFSAIMIIIAMFMLSFCIFVWIRYANVPLKDLPAWVLPFFGK